MRLKSYFAGSVEAAMSEASRELGSDAMLVYSREAPPEASYLGTYEVVFALPSSEAPAATGPQRPEPLKGPAAPPATSGELAELTRELAEMKRQMTRMAGMLVRTHTLPGSGGWRSQAFGEVLQDLLEAGLSAELTNDVAARLDNLPDLDLANDDSDTIRRALRGVLEGLFSVDARLGAADGGARAAAVVGPPGSGKTSTLVKLAARYGLRGRTPVQILSMDGWRVGGAEQLRSYASILGAGFQTAETPGALAQALEEHRHKDLVLIDTPGYGMGDMEAGNEVASFLRSNRDVDVHLTLTASMKNADLAHAVTCFEHFRPRSLIFTKMDETVSIGGALNEAIRTGKPISFLSIGQQIPEDLEEAAKDVLLDRILDTSGAAVKPTGNQNPPGVASRRGNPAGSHAAAA